MRDAMVLAYLTPQYPKVSHTFIRREIRALEALGHRILRLAIRESEDLIVDPADREEVGITLHCLSRPKAELLAACARIALDHPARFAAALGATLAMGRSGDRGLLRHLAYLVEAAYFLGVVRRERAEHVHVHFGTNAAKVALLMRRLGGPPFSVTYHGPDEFDDVSGHALSSVLAEASFAFGISSYTTAQLRRWLAPERWDRIQRVHCAVDEQFFEASRPLEESCRSFVCVGRLTAQKGQHVLVEALERLVKEGVDARLVLAGDGELRQSIEQRVAELGLGERVEITGWVDEREVRRRLLDARALVLPSFAEGLPVVLMEALAIGRPVISTYVAGIPELVHPGENGWLVPAGDVDALASAMRDALATPAASLNEMGRVGADCVRLRHTASVEAEKIDALLAGPRAPASLG